MAVSFFESQHAKLKAERGRPTQDPRATGGFGGATESAEAQAANEAFRRAQAEAAEKAKNAAREDQEQRRASALANARMSLGGYESGLRAGADVLRALLKEESAKGAAVRADRLAKKVANIPDRFEPPFDAAKPDARSRLEAFRVSTSEALRDAKTQLVELEKELTRAQAQQTERTKRLTDLRHSLAGARETTNVLAQYQAPAQEIAKWDSFLEARAQEIERLSHAARADANHVADLSRQIERLRSSIPYTERQIWQSRVVEQAEAQLRSSFKLSKADFARHAKEWKARIELVSEGLEERIKHLEGELVHSMFQARNSMGTVGRQAVIICSEKTLADVARAKASISQDVLEAVSPELRAKLEAMFSDFERLGAAFTERPRRQGPPVRIANLVTGLANPKLEHAWNVQVQFGIDVEKARDDAIWAGRDPTKFY
ncbi:MAG: hypothetical protein IT384_29125 [Deltaproteobacteria bacterium]|nr:hypothetical protein [Deltaproteobacteria bacterium]